MHFKIMAISKKDFELDNRNLSMLPIKVFDRAIILHLRINVQINILALQGT